MKFSSAALAESGGSEPVSGSMAHGPEESQLARLFAPRSIAVVGASPDPRRIGSRVLANVRRHGYGGRVHIVNPHHDELDGLPVYLSLIHI